MEAKYYSKLTDKKVKCLLCPHNCTISNNKSGICKVRSNIDGILYSDMYGCLSATHFDPIEKKPLYHFFPGSEILSLGALGCNFHCLCCQNSEISQTGKEGFPRLQYFSVDDIVNSAIRNSINLGIAYTYNEPTVWYEYMFDIAKEIKKAQRKNVVVSNGYLNKKPLRALLPLIDAFNIDIKVYDAAMYKRFTGGEMASVFENLETIFKSGSHLEITMLVVPGVNDNMDQFKDMITWISDNLSSNVPLHLSRYFPHYKMNLPPTSDQLLKDFANYAGEHLNFVYIGNMLGNDFQNTFCPNCGSLSIKRNGYNSRILAVDKLGCCTDCGYKIIVA